MSGFTEKPDGLGTRPSDGPGGLGWGKGGGGGERESGRPAAIIDPNNRDSSKTLSQYLAGKGSEFSIPSFFDPGFCGGVGRLPFGPVANNVSSGFNEKPDGPGTRPSDGPG